MDEDGAAEECSGPAMLPSALTPPETPSVEVEAPSAAAEVALSAGLKLVEGDCLNKLWRCKSRRRCEIPNE